MSTPAVVEPPAKDPVAIGLGALGAGLGLGGGVLTIALALVRAIEHSNVVIDTSTDILVGLFAGIAVAAFFGWRRSLGIENIFQRGAIAAISAFGSVMVGFVFTTAVDHFFGWIGVAVFGLLLIGGGIWSGTWACRAAG